MILNHYGSFDGQADVWMVGRVRGLRVVARAEDGRWYKHLPTRMIKWRWLDDEEVESTLERTRTKVLDTKP